MYQRAEKDTRRRVNLIAVVVSPCGRNVEAKSCYAIWPAATPKWLGVSVGLRRERRTLDDPGLAAALLRKEKDGERRSDWLTGLHYAGS